MTKKQKPTKSKKDKNLQISEQTVEVKTQDKSLREEETRIVEIASDERLAELAKPAQKELEKQNKKTTLVKKLSAIWTIISTIYAIVSTGILIGRGWVSNVVSGVLIAILAVYICVFIVLAVFTFKDVKGGEKRVKMYKKTLKIFKGIANVVLLSLTAVSMVGMSLNGMDAIVKLIVFIMSFVVAVVQLGLKITLLALKLIRMKIAKKFKVEYVKFVNGKKQKKSVALKLKEKKYKEK